MSQDTGLLGIMRSNPLSTRKEFCVPENIEWLKNSAQLKQQVDKYGSFAELSRATGISVSTIKTAWTRLGLSPRGRKSPVPVTPSNDPNESDQLVLDAIGKLGDGATIEALADKCEL